jgi:hypothetical protein
MLKNSWSPTGMNTQNSHFLAHLLLLQRSLLVKLGVSPSRSRSLTRSHSLSSGDSTISHRQQCWDEVSPHHKLQSTIYNTPAYCSRSPGLKSWLADRLCWEVFVVFLSPYRKISWKYLKLGHDRFFHTLFHPISIYHSLILHNIVWVTEKLSLMNTLRNV